MPKSRIELELPETRWITFADLARLIDQDPRLLHQIRNPGTVILGKTSQDVPLLLRLSASDIQNCLIVGQSGSGKTELLRTLITSCLNYQHSHDVQIGLFCASSSRKNFASYAHVPHLIFPIATYNGEILSRLQYLVSELEKRKQNSFNRPLIIVILDELNALQSTSENNFQDLVHQLIQQGFRYGICVIGCLTEPSNPTLTSPWYSVFKTKILGKAVDRNNDLSVTRTLNLGTEHLLGQGDFLLVTGSHPIRFQAARSFPSDINPSLAPGKHKFNLLDALNLK